MLSVSLMREEKMGVREGGGPQEWRGAQFHVRNTCRMLSGEVTWIGHVERSRDVKCFASEGRKDGVRKGGRPQE